MILDRHDMNLYYNGCTFIRESHILLLRDCRAVGAQAELNVLGQHATKNFPGEWGASVSLAILQTPEPDEWMPDFIKIPARTGYFQTGPIVSHVLRRPTRSAKKGFCAETYSIYSLPDKVGIDFLTFLQGYEPELFNYIHLLRPGGVDNFNCPKILRDILMPRPLLNYNTCVEALCTGMVYAATWNKDFAISGRVLCKYPVLYYGRSIVGYIKHDGAAFINKELKAITEHLVESGVDKISYE